MKYWVNFDKVLNAKDARKQGLNPVIRWHSPGMRLGKSVIFKSESGWKYPLCEVCDEQDWPVVDGIANGGNLTEYPKRSMTFWCTFCFVNHHDEKTVNRVMGTEEERGWTLSQARGDY